MEEVFASSAISIGKEIFFKIKLASQIFSRKFNFKAFAKRRKRAEEILREISPWI